MTELEIIQDIFDELDPYVADRFAHRASLDISSKRDAHDILIEVDVEAQRRIVARIRAAHPHDHIVAEESGMTVLPDDPKARCWMIDPIDGTQNFVRGLFPIFGISIAFCAEGRAEAGGVSLPVTQDRFLARRGAGGKHNGAALRVAEVDSLALARLEIEFGNASRAHSLRIFPNILRAAGQIRCFGAAVFGLCSVATGDADGYLHSHINPWDFAAAALILEEAGGLVTRPDGTPVDLFGSTGAIIATNGLIHEEVLGLLET